jgi:hypothetical protein
VIIDDKTAVTLGGASIGDMSRGVNVTDRRLFFNGKRSLITNYVDDDGDGAAFRWFEVDHNPTRFITLREACVAAGYTWRLA